MSTLPVVEEILRETEIPMSVRQIVEHAGARLPTKSKTPDTVVARDLSMDIKKKGEASLFIRTAPGRYTIRAIALRKQAEAAGQVDAAQPASPQAPIAAAHGNGAPNTTGAPPAASTDVTAPTPVLSSAMRADRAAPMAARKSPSVSEDSHTAGRG
jgi:hypothetical protein